jgi:cytoskeletal protein RodZ
VRRPAAPLSRVGGPAPPVQVPGLKPRPKPVDKPETIAPEPVRRGSPGWINGLLLLVLVAVSAGGWYFWRQSRAELEKPSATPATPNPAPAPAKRKPSATTAPAPSDTSSTQPTPDSSASASDPQPTATTAVLKIVTTPSGATVELDGKPVNVDTPTVIDKLDPGDHNVVITKSGYKSEKKPVTLEAGKSKLLALVLTKAVAAPATATIEITSTPVGADVTVDGQPVTGVTPTTASVAPGAHVVLVRKQGFQPSEANVNLRAGEKYSFAPELQQQQGKGLLRRMFGGGAADRVPLMVRTMPPGAQVTIDSTVLPKPTPLRAPVPAGTHHMVIKMDGFKTVERDITLTKGQPLEIQERLVRGQ